MTASYANPTYQTPTRLNQLPAAASVNAGDLLLISQNGVSKQATASQVADGGLSPTGVTAGTYGTASQVGQFTVNAQGLLTSASDIAIAIAASQVTSGQLAVARGGTGADLSATGGANQFVRQSSVGGAFTVSTLANADLPDSGVSAATYGSGTAVPVIAVNVKGIITSATTAAVDVPGSLGTQTANTVYSGPASAGPSAPTFRALVNADIPATLTGKAFNGTLGATTPSTVAATTISASGQITSTVSTGTAPFVVASTTAVTNLNSSLLLGGTWASPGTIGSTTPNTGAFTTLVASGQTSLGGVAGSESLRAPVVASANRYVIASGSNGGQPYIGTSGGGLAFAPAGTVSASVITGGLVSVPNTAIPAGGTAGVGIQMSSTSQFGIFFGSGAPTLSAAQGSIYLRSDGTTTNDRAYIRTAAGWTAIITAS